VTPATIAPQRRCFGTNKKDNPMTRILLLAATAVSLVVPVATADAGSRHKHKHYYRHHHGAVYAPGYYGPRAYGGLACTGLHADTGSAVGDAE
jgi:hypothetical protein